MEGNEETLAHIEIKFSASVLINYGNYDFKIENYKELKSIKIQTKALEINRNLDMWKFPKLEKFELIYNIPLLGLH